MRKSRTGAHDNVPVPPPVTGKTPVVVGPETVRVTNQGLTVVGEKWTATGVRRGSVLLLHGGGQRRFSWSETGQWLARSGWDAYAFDARGHGESDWAPDGDYSMTALVSDAMAILETIGEPAFLVGASMGGMTALIAEGEQGPLARGLVLVDIVARIERAGARRIQEFMKGAPDGFATLEEVSDAIAAYNPHRPRPKNLDGLRKNLIQRENGRWYWHWDPLLMQDGNEPDREVHYTRSRAAAGGITVPTLLVRGAHSDIVSDDGLREMQELIPHAGSVEVRAAGHMIAGDDNDVFTSELLRFLEAAVEPQQP